MTVERDLDRSGCTSMDIIKVKGHLVKKIIARTNACTHAPDRMLYT